MKDPALEAFVSAIEAHFTRLRGSESGLSPHDFALARAWHAAGVPPALVLSEIDRAFAQGGVSSLAYLRRRIEARAARARRPPPASRAAGVAAPGRDVEARAWLRALAERLVALPEAARSAFEACAPRLRGILEQLENDRPLRGEALEAQLQALDEALDEAALAACSDEQRRAFRQEAARATARQRGRLDPVALETAVRRYERRRARAELRLPALG